MIAQPQMTAANPREVELLRMSVRDTELLGGRNLLYAGRDGEARTNSSDTALTQFFSPAW